MYKLHNTDIFSTGWFGIPGASSRLSTKVHLVSNGKPVCGSKISTKQEYMWCSHGIMRTYLECEHCKKIANKLLAVGVNRKVA